jgi:hypothetical protein
MDSGTVSWLKFAVGTVASLTAVVVVATLIVFNVRFKKEHDQIIALRAELAAAKEEHAAEIDLIQQNALDSITVLKAALRDRAPVKVSERLPTDDNMYLLWDREHEAWRFTNGAFLRTLPSFHKKRLHLHYQEWVELPTPPEEEP